MFIYELLLFVLTLTLVVGVPLYIFFRNRMVKSSKVQIHPRKRVLKITLINLSLNTIIYLIFLTMLITLLLKGHKIDLSVVITSILFLLITGLSFYGNGIYITSIVLEAYTLPELKSLSSFKTQFIATHLFHGPISHILIYSGYILALLLLGILDVLTGRGTLILAPYLLACGIVVGVMYAWGQIFNGTIPYQFLTCLFSLFALMIFLSLKQASLFNFSVASYFFGFAITFLLSGLVYFLLKGRNKENFWDLSGD